MISLDRILFSPFTVETLTRLPAAGNRYPQNFFAPDRGLWHEEAKQDMRILSLDGGGTWALLQAMALGSLYGDATPGREILRRFDYVAATSGGSIVLGGLLNDWSPAKIAALFLDEEKRKSIFVARGWGILRPGVARWSTAGKIQGLKAVLGDATLSELAALVPRDAGRPPLQIVITAYDYDRNRARFFRSNPASAASNSGAAPPVTIAQAVHASSTAPVIYFDQPADLGSSRPFLGRRSDVV